MPLFHDAMPLFLSAMPLLIKKKTWRHVLPMCPFAFLQTIRKIAWSKGDNSSELSNFDAIVKIKMYCISFYLRLLITPLVSSNLYCLHPYWNWRSHYREREHWHFNYFSYDVIEITYTIEVSLTHYS